MELSSANFFQNLFGTIAGPQIFDRLPGNINVIPLDGSGNVLGLKNQVATWLGLKLPLQQKYAYEYCYPLASVIDRLAEADISGMLEINFASGKGKEKPATNAWSVAMMARLQSPNPLQSWEQFRGQQNVYKRIFGYCPVLPIIPSGFENQPWLCTALVNLPPWLFDAVPMSNGNFLYESDVDEVIKEYTLSFLGRTYVLKASSVMMLEDSFHQDDMKNFLLPKSKLVGLDMAVSNLCAAMEADNVLLRKKGPLGFISHDAAATKDGTAGYVPMDDEEKSDLQQDLQLYGMSFAQAQYVISKTAVKWNPISFDVKQLGTKETVLAAARAICQRFGFPYVLFEDSDATYSNQASAHKKFYDDVVLPANKRDMNRYNLFFKAKENNCCIDMDYMHLGVFQEDERQRGMARNYLDQGLQIEYLNDVITKNQWLAELELEPVPDGDLYYSQSSAKLAQDNMKMEQAKLSAQQTTPNPGNTNA